MKQSRPFRKFLQGEDQVPLDIIGTMDRLFTEWLSSQSWNPWRTVLRAAFALEMSAQEIEFFKSIAGGRDPPRKRVKELWVVAGRRSGKSAITS
jgi:hypothetical protein